MPVCLHLRRVLRVFQTSGASIFATATCYTSEDVGQRTYQGPTAARQVTALSTRTFGTWTLLSSAIRAYAAYDISNKGVYAVAFTTFAIALAHFSSEWLVYRTMTMRKGLLPPLTVASITTIWMIAQRGYYTRP